MPSGYPDNTTAGGAVGVRVGVNVGVGVRVGSGVTVKVAVGVEDGYGVAVTYSRRIMVSRGVFFSEQATSTIPPRINIRTQNEFRFTVKILCSIDRF